MIDKDGEAFIELLRGLREGRAANEAGRSMADVVRGVTDTYGAGTLTLTLRVAMQKDSADIVETVDAVASKVPEERKDTWFFGAGGVLMHSRPRVASADPPLFGIRDPEGSPVFDLDEGGATGTDDS